MKLIIFWFLFVALFHPLVIAQQNSANSIDLRQNVTLYSGPGMTYREIGTLSPADDLMLTIHERNALGNWVMLHITEGTTQREGWVLTGYLDLPETVQFSEVPINPALSDAAPYNVDDPRLARLYTLPILPEMNENLLIVYVIGQMRGNRSNVITKIGDSLSTSPVYLTPMPREDHRLGAYDFLADSIAYFGESLTRQSVASRVGLNTYSIFDTMWSAPQLCEQDETPLNCEIRLARPGIAVILFGPNDMVSRMTVDEYYEQMRQIIETTLSQGVIPLLSTFSTNPQSIHWDRAIDFNLALVSIAEEYEVPIMNLWLAARTLPNFGLARDNIHMQHGTYEYFNFTTGHEATVGVSLQNLVALGALDRLYTFLQMDSATN